MHEIAKERNMAIVTIQGHLSWFVGNGDIDINKLVPLEKQLLIKAAIKSHGIESHKILKDNLPENISYGEIKLVIAVEQKRRLKQQNLFFSIKFNTANTEPIIAKN